jgi:hypothetical protein
MTDPDDWAYYYAAQNFAQGHFTVDTQTHNQQVSEAQQKGGSLIQYVNIGNNKWALEKAPGYNLYLIPFQKLGIPRYGNVLLALGMILVSYVLLKRLRDERTAMIGCLLLLLTPLALIMLNRTYMDTYPSLAFLVMGVGLYLYYYLERKNLSPVKGGILLFLAVLLTGWSVVTRYTNAPIAIIVGLHYVIMRIITCRKGDRYRYTAELLPLVGGLFLSVGGVLLYNYGVFGSPFKYGYNYTHFDISFAYQYIGQVNRNGQSVTLQIILDNLRDAPKALFLAFPLLAVGIPAFICVLVQKVIGFFKKNSLQGKWSSLRAEISWDVLLLLMGWFISVFGLYLTYQWTANQGSGSFLMFSRFYLPGLFPVVVLTAMVLARLPLKILIPVLTVILGFSAVVYIQWAWNLSILPAWFNTSSGRGRSPGGYNPGFPGNGQPTLPQGNQGLPHGNGGNFYRFNPGERFQPPSGR